MASRPTVNGSGVVDLEKALRRAAARPRTAQGWVHAGPGLLEEAADRIRRLEDRLALTQPNQHQQPDSEEGKSDA